MSRKKHSDEEVLIQIGEILRKLRFEAGYTSYETFANEHELDRKQYWRIENGTNVTIKTLLKILRIHRMTLKDFFNCES